MPPSPTAPLTQNVQQPSCLSIFANLLVSTSSECDPKRSRCTARSCSYFGFWSMICFLLSKFINELIHY